MNFELTEEQKMVQAMARDFADQEIKPKAQELDQTERHPAEIVQKMAAIMQSAHEPSQLFPFKPLDDLKR